MRNFLLLLSLAPWLALSAVSPSVAPALVSSDSALAAPVDWPAFIGAADMTWSKMPSRWQEAPHFGNAMLGSMLYRQGDVLRLQLFRADAQDHRDDSYGWPAYSRPRLMAGSLLLRPVGKITGCSWRKDLWNAELTGTITTDKGRIAIRHYVHARDMVVVTEITPDAGESGATWDWKSEPARTTRPGYPEKTADIAKFAAGYGKHYTADTLKLFRPNPPEIAETHDDVSVRRQDFIAGGRTVSAWKEVRDVSGKRTLFATIEHSYPDLAASERVETNLREASRTSAGALTDSHRSWWHDYYRRSYVHIPDTNLEKLYWRTIYRYGCTSRTGRFYTDTPGIWFQGGGWTYTTTDWNIQAAHWAVGPANRLEQGEELADRLYKHADELVKAVRPAAWQADSAFLPLAVSGDMIGNREQDMRWYDLTGNLPWALNNCWSLYRYSMDDAVLREKLYPLLRRSVNFYLHMLSEGPDGKWHLPPTISPEAGRFKDCNFDLALLKWGCHTLLNASRRLGIEDPLKARWEEVIARTPDYPSDENGYRLGADRTSDPAHRHGSHLLMIYPLHLVNIDRPATFALAEKSYRRFDATKGLPAMVQAHAGAIGADLGLGDVALAGLRRQAADLYPNGLWYSPPCIEASLAAANTVQEMLLQSWCDPADRTQIGLIRVFPAMPSGWKDAEFHDLRAEGAFLVSAKRAEGKTTEIRIQSLAGEPCRLKSDLGEDPVVTPARPVKALGSGVLEITLAKGESVVLRPRR